MFVKCNKMSTFFSAAVSGAHKLGGDVDLLFVVKKTSTFDMEFLTSFEHSVHKALKEEKNAEILLSLKAVHGKELIVYLKQPLYLK